MKRFLLPIFISLFLVFVSACSNSAPETQSNTAAPEPTEQPAPEPAKDPVQEPTQEPTAEPVETVEFRVEGSYKLFGVMNKGLLVKSEELEMESDVVLNEGGTGTMSSDGDSIDITKWELNGDTVSITLSDGGQADAKVHDGILELDLYGDGSMVLDYAQDGADLSGFEFISLEEAREKLKES